MASRRVDFRPPAKAAASRERRVQRDFFALSRARRVPVDAVERLDQIAELRLDLLTLVEPSSKIPSVWPTIGQAEDAEVAELRRWRRIRRSHADSRSRAPQAESRVSRVELRAVRPAPPLGFAREPTPQVGRARESSRAATSFSGYTKYGSHAPGCAARYLTDVIKTLVQPCPNARERPRSRTDRKLCALVRGVDSSLIDEWERLKDPLKPRVALDDAAEEADTGLSDRTLTALTRNLLFSFLRALASRDFESALDLVEAGEVSWLPADLERAARPLLEESAPIQLDAQGRSPVNTRVAPDADFWQVLQNIVLEGEVSEYIVRGRLDVARSAAERRAVFLLVLRLAPKRARSLPSKRMPCSSVSAGAPAMLAHVGPGGSANTERPALIWTRRHSAAFDETSLVRARWHSSHKAKPALGTREASPREWRASALMAVRALARSAPCSVRT